MEKFSEDKVCDKCGCREKKVELIQNNLLFESKYHGNLRVECKQCGFVWTALPLDYEED